MGGATPITDHWHELVTVSLLGTDRRDPPPAPAGPLADVVEDTVRASPSGRMLAHVAATVVARRAGLRPGPPAAALVAPDADPRALLPPAAAARWRSLVREWAVLEDEWLLGVRQGNWRLPPDVLVSLLRRHRADPLRASWIAAIGGPLVPWLVEQQPQLAPARADGRRQAVPRSRGELPGLAVPPDLLRLLDAGPVAVRRAIVSGFAGASYTIAHGQVLGNFIARCRPDALAPLAEGLRHLDPALPAGGLAHSLADLALARAAMLHELEPG